MVTVGGLPLAILFMMPAFAEEVVQTNATGLGLLLASSAVGAVLSTLLVVRLRSGRRGRAVMISSLLLPLFLLGFAASRSMPVACLTLLVVGVIQSVQHATVHHFGPGERARPGARPRDEPVQHVGDRRSQAGRRADRCTGRGYLACR